MFSFLPHKFSKYFITFYHRKPRNMLLLPGKKKKKKTSVEIGMKTRSLKVWISAMLAVNKKLIPIHKILSYKHLIS